MVGSLVLAGIGFRPGLDVTMCAKSTIEHSDHLFYVVDDQEIESWLRGLNSNAICLRSLLRDHGSPRGDAYQVMAEAIVAPLRDGKRVCAVFDGHPGILTDPAHRARELAIGQGYEVKILPGISAEASLFADLGIDPGETGWQSFDATDFLIHRRGFDPHSLLLLYQVAMIGAPGYRVYDARCLHILIDRLMQTYDPDHQIVVYEAVPGNDPGSAIRRRRLSALEAADVSQRSLLCVPPLAPAKLDVVMVARLARIGAEHERTRRHSS